ncbi:MAG: glycosyltransferase [Candidatus Krumholzibacteriia bacterium]
MPPATLLLVNKFYHDRGPAGGVGRYLVQEEEDLTAAGWTVVPFTMAEPETRPSPWAGYFVQARDYTRPRFGIAGLRDAASLIWNREAARKLDDLVLASRPTVAHLHNVYHHLSPSILPILERHGVPVAMTLHDLRLLCPAIHMLRRGEICERCRGGRFHHAVLGRCVKDSVAASALAALETFHQRSRGLYTDNVDLFLCPSRFILEKYADWGFPRRKLHHLPNFVDLEAWHPDQLHRAGDPDSYLYFGRISKEKGLRTLLDAQALWEEGHRSGTIAVPPLRLLIAGEGPCLENLKAHLALLKLRTVELLGPLDREGLRRALGRARFTVLPSECYENSPMAALESLASGLPLVGSRIGGIPEIVEDGVTGCLTEPGDARSLVNGLLQAASLPPGASAACRRWAERHASRRAHMAALQEILGGLADR